MKKTKKLILVSIIAIIFTLISFNSTYAHNVDIDPDYLISLPTMIFGGEGKISVKSTETNYKLYWQAVEISNSEYKKLDDTRKQGEKDLADLEAKAKNLKAEYQNLKTILDEKESTYQQAVTNKLSEEEIDAADKARKTAQKNYTDKVNEYNAKVGEYNGKIKEINSEIKRLTPGYVDANWIETSDTSFKVDLSKFSGNKVFVIWAKLVSNGKISYDETIYTMNGTKAEDIKVTEVTLNESNLTLEEGSTRLLSATIKPTDATEKSVTWSSSDEEVATVKDGNITAVKEGTATITVKTKDGEYTSTCKVTVTKKNAESKTEEEKNKKEETKDEDTKNKENEDNTISPKPHPQTGTSFIYVGLLIALIVVCVILYKKNKSLKF